VIASWLLNNQCSLEEAKPASGGTLDYHDEPELGFLQTDGAGFVEDLKVHIARLSDLLMYEQKALSPPIPEICPSIIDALKNKLRPKLGNLELECATVAHPSSRRVW
jgi:hypothetical protein